MPDRSIDQSRPFAYAGVDPSIPPNLSVSRAVQHLEGAQFAQAAERVRYIAQTLLEPASMGEGLLGGKLWNVTDEMWT
ncbi:hypothetical protein NKH92_24570 [Mesorhizobium sp. M0871]|nr:hypothetical protein [Mesorhizobium sp. LSHC412B00]